MDAAMGSTQRLTAFLIRHDNRLLGVVLGLTALHTWANLFESAGRYAAYMGYGVIATPGLSLLAIGCSAVYLTAVSAILLTARKPLARYNTLGPNLMAVVAGFGVYAFSLLPPAPQPRVDLLLPLALLAAGTATVLLALVYLRRAFSVTPQARAVVRAGPYSLVRHPMYVGNILYIAGMGLLLGTGPALLLALLLCALQGVRARYEERLLTATFAGYAAYAPPQSGEVRSCINVAGPHAAPDPPADRTWHLDEAATADLLAALSADPAVRRIFVEPHLKLHLGFARDPKVRFAGCRAARHDDHLHVDFF